MSKLAERLRELIEEDVATGQLPPGSRVDEAELAMRHGVSRTPVREALSLLVGEGLLEAGPRRGLVVAQVSAPRLVEMFEVMAELEAMCARLAARRISEPELVALQARHAACLGAAQANDPDGYFYANEAFHQALYAASHNAFLTEQATALQRRLRPYRRLQLRVRNRLQRSLAEHQAIVDALRAADTDQAVEATRQHVLVQGERFSDLLAGLQRLEASDSGPTQAKPAAGASAAAVPLPG